MIDNKKFLIFQGSSEDNQNSDKSNPIWANDDIKASKTLKQKTSQPQVIFLKDKQEVDGITDLIMQKLPTDLTKKGKTTRNYTYPEIIAMEKFLSLEGLDLVQAMILDRQYFNQTQHHLFNRSDNNSIWVTKTKNQVKTGRCSRFFWSTGRRRWIVNLDHDSYFDDDLGSVFSRSLETTG